MFKAIKRLFVFDYLSPLDIATCGERLTFAYKQRMVETGLMKESKHRGWSLSMTPCKKGGIVVFSESRLGGQWAPKLSYHVALKELEHGTLLHIANNPFGFSALGVMLLIAIGMLLGFVIGFMNNQAGYGMFVPFFLIFSTFCLVDGYYGRRHFIRYLRTFLDAEPI